MPTLDLLLDLVGDCSSEVTFAANDTLLREGEPEVAFYVLRTGTVALETFVPSRGPVTVQTLHGGDLLGWSWLVAPHRVAFDARALEDVSAVAFDAACVRARMDADPGLARELLARFVPVIIGRLQHTRLQLLDVYAGAP